MQTPLNIQIAKPKLFKRRYEYLANEKLLATLQYEGSVKRKAIATVNDKQWVIQRTGWWKPLLEITAQQSPYTKWRLPTGWKHKLTLRADDGITYHFGRPSLWSSRWIWTDDKKNTILEITSRAFSRKERGRLTVFYPEREAVYLLMLVGWFLVINYEEEASVITTTTTITH